MSKLEIETKVKIIETKEVCTIKSVRETNNKFLYGKYHYELKEKPGIEFYRKELEEI